jgi:hypothetical protein
VGQSLFEMRGLHRKAEQLGDPGARLIHAMRLAKRNPAVQGLTRRVSQNSAPWNFRGAKTSMS